ncbi:transport protein Trs120 or TRAPPC9 TRAPP II complex subunit-domain-containing protein [Coemansia spiralis]|nr:transport protein Trs120 or TRAPPC9 TRAPP II complex subunit-domain-containing protein [Coemansia spiralis]
MAEDTSVGLQSRSTSPVTNLSSSHSPFSDGQIESISRRHCFVASTVTPVDAAGIRVLLVPVGPVRQEKMLHWANAIAQFSRLQISDILPYVDSVLATKYSNSARNSEGGGIGGGMDTEGELRFLFSVNDSEDHEYLEGIQTYRQILGVIGIIDCQLCDNIAGCYEEFLHVLAQNTTAVAYKCLAFDPLLDQPDDLPGVTVIPNVGGSLLFYLQTLLCDFAGTMVTALNLMAKSIEDRADLQSPLGESSVLSPLNGSSVSLDKDATSPTTSILPEIRNSRSSIHETSSAAAYTMTHRISTFNNYSRRQSTQSLPTSDSGGAQGDLPNEPLDHGRYGGEMDRDAVATTIDKPGPSQPNLSPSSSTFASSMRERRKVGNGSGAGGASDSVGVGRLKKLQGDLYLMSGRLSEACAAYSASISSNRAFNDYLWQAVAMEGYCAALLQLCQRPSERRLVSAFLSTKPKTSVSEPSFSLANIRASMIISSQQTAQAGTTTKAASAADNSATKKNNTGSTGTEGLQNKAMGLAEVLGEIGELFGQIPLLYEKCYSFAPLLHAEACIREALVLLSTRESFLHDSDKALDTLLQINRLYPQTVDKSVQTTRDVVANARSIPLRAVINDWLQRGWSSSYSSLALSDQLEMSSEISSMFRSLGYSRKSFFFLRQFLLMAIPVLLRTSSAGQAGNDRNNSAPSTPVRPSESPGNGYSAMSTLVDGASAFAAVSAAAAAATTSASFPGANGAPWQTMQMQQLSVNTPGNARTSFESGKTSNSDPNATAGYLPSSFNTAYKEWVARSRPTLRQAVIVCLDALVYSFSTGVSQASIANQKRTLKGSRSSLQEGWLSIQVDAIRECLSIAEALPSYPHAIAAGFRLVSCLNELSATASDLQRRELLEEQHMVRNYLHRTIALYHQRYHFDPALLKNRTNSYEYLAIQTTGSSSSLPQVVGRDASVVGGVLDSLLVGIQFCTFPENAALILTSNKESKPQTAAPSLFLHNPSAQLHGDVPPLLAAHEDAYFVATLSNPFSFALQLTEVELISTISPAGSSNTQEENNSERNPLNLVSSDRIKADRVNCIIPPGGQGQVLLKIIPGIAGLLKVKGVSLSLFQHLSVQCLLAEEKEGDAKQRVRERPLKQRLEAERNSLLGLDKPLPDSPSVRLSVMNAGHLLSTTVVSPLPKLSVIESSLAREESLSLYEGESRVVKLTLVNGSSVATAERFSITFEPLSDDKKAGDDSVAGLRMCDLVDAAFSYMRGSETTSIGPRRTYCLQVRVSGITGLNGGEVVIRYGNSNTPDWSRELRWPLLVSVSRLLIPAKEKNNGSKTKYTSLPPYIARSLSSNSDIRTSASKELTGMLRDLYLTIESSTSRHSVSIQEPFYLAEINVCNMGSADVQLTVETDLSGDQCSETETLHIGTAPKKSSRLVKSLDANLPGHRSLTRVVVPFRRACLDSAVVSSPMPGIEANGGPDKGIFYSWRTSLVDEQQKKQQDSVSEEQWVHSNGSRGKRRQFVLSKTAELSEIQLSMRREIYWYQLEIARRVRMRWVCRQSGRHGYIDPRQFFDIGEHELDIIRPKELHMEIAVNNALAQRVDWGILQANCAIGEQSKLEFTLTNTSTSNLDVDFSICVISDPNAYAGGHQNDYKGTEDEHSAFVSDAYYYHPDSSFNIDAVAAASINLNFTSSLVDSRAGFGNGRFIFRTASGGLGTDQNVPVKDKQRDYATDSLLVPLPSYSRGLAFDDIHGIQLPTLAPNATRSLELPIYILRSGRYQLEYKVSKRPPERGSRNMAVDLVQDVLIIDTT